MNHCANCNGPLDTGGNCIDSRCRLSPYFINIEPSQKGPQQAPPTTVSLLRAILEELRQLRGDLARREK